MAQPYTFTLIPDPDEPGYAIKVNELPGCISQGATAEEAMMRIREAMEVWIESRLEEGRPVPEPGESSPL
jgi:antitoxin HicB